MIRVGVFKRAVAFIAVQLMCIGAVLVVGATTQSASAADCLRAHAWYKFDNIRRNDVFASDYTYIRSNPYAGCGRVSWGHRWHDVNMHCWVINDVGKLWAHLWNRDTQVNGWVYGENFQGWVPLPKYNCDDEPWVEI